MKGLSALGSEGFFLVLFPFLYWCLDSRLGLRLAVVYFLSSFLNHALKQVLAQPRPADLLPGIALVEQPGYGLPSGHAQGAVVLWGLLTVQAVRRGALARSCGVGRWLWAPAALLMLGIGLSRVYLGVHFPTDVLAGWAIGAAVLAAAAGVLRRLEVRTGASAPARAGAGARAPSRARVPSPIRAPARSPALAPARAPMRRLPWWVGIPIMGLLAGAALLLVPEKDSLAMVAAMWGFASGHLLRRRLLGGGEEGTAGQRLLRLPAGLAVLLGLYLGLKSLFPAEGQSLYLPLRFARYALAGAWASLGAPLLFRWLGLALPGRATGASGR